MRMTAAFYNNFFLDPKGNLFACGNNSYNQLGYEESRPQYLPVKVMEQMKVVVTGEKHSLFLKVDGTLWAVGNNEFGQLGTGNTDNQYIPVQVASDVRRIATGRDFSFFDKKD